MLRPGARGGAPDSWRSETDQSRACAVARDPGVPCGRIVQDLAIFLPVSQGPRRRRQTARGSAAAGDQQEMDRCERTSSPGWRPKRSRRWVPEKPPVAPAPAHRPRRTSAAGLDERSLPVYGNACGASRSSTPTCRDRQLYRRRRKERVNPSPVMQMPELSCRCSRSSIRTRADFFPSFGEKGSISRKGSSRLTPARRSARQGR